MAAASGGLSGPPGQIVAARQTAGSCKKLTKALKNFVQRTILCLKAALLPAI
jgi:hypothetical protein